MHSNTILLGKLNTMVITKLVLSLTLLYALRINYYNFFKLHYNDKKKKYIYIYIYKLALNRAIYNNHNARFVIHRLLA